MEFKISKKANRLTMLLIVVGVLFTAIGVALNINDHHFTTRFLVSGLTSSMFFFSLGIGALFFLALQYATETGWYASIKRVIEAVAGFLPFGIAFLVLVLLVITILDGAHIYTWMDPAVTDPTNHHYDEIIDGKSGYLNKSFFWIRTVVYLGVYFMFWRGFRKRSLEEDRVGGTDIHFKNFGKAAMFLVFFAVTSSTSSWDWLMSIDVHWFSTLYGWYTFLLVFGVLLWLF